MARIKGGDIPGGEQAFERLIAKTGSRYGTDSVQVADTLSAFGVELFYADRRAESAVYLSRAIDVYRKAFGPDDPEVALALHTYAQAVFDGSPEAPPAEVVSALEEALRIRRNTLGLDNAETAVNFIFLGRVKGSPPYTANNPAALDEAVDLIQFGIDLLGKSPNGDDDDLPGSYRRLAEVYALNHHGAEAIAATDQYVQAVRALGREVDVPQPDKDCDCVVDKIATMLATHGEPDAARTVRTRYVAP